MRSYFHARVITVLYSLAKQPRNWVSGQHTNLTGSVLDFLYSLIIFILFSSCMDCGLYVFCHSIHSNLTCHFSSFLFLFLLFYQWNIQGAAMRSNPSPSMYSQSWNILFQSVHLVYVFLILKHYQIQSAVFFLRDQQEFPLATCIFMNAIIRCCKLVISSLLWTDMLVTTSNRASQMLFTSHQVGNRKYRFFIMSAALSSRTGNFPIPTYSKSPNLSPGNIYLTYFWRFQNDTAFGSSWRRENLTAAGLSWNTAFKP